MAAVDTHVETSNQNTLETEQDKALLDTFWQLADPSDNIRLKGASDLLEIVIRKQKQHNKSGVPGLYCSEVEYTLKRLVKGLASGRKGARLGYVTVLAELLERVPRISLDAIFTLVQEHLVVKGKKEERDFIFGQVFAYLAIIQSGRVQRSDEKYTVEVIQSLLTLGEHKSYLQEICCKGIIDVITKTSEDAFLDNVWPKLKPKLKVGWEDATAESLALLMVCQKQFPDVVKPKFVQSHWGHSNLLDESNFHHMGRILVQSTIHSHPNVHFVCDLILSQALQDKAKVPLFWQKVVDESLCAARQECKFLAFKLVERIVPSCNDARLIKAVFSHTLLKVFINSLSNKQGFLHKAAVQFSQNLPNAVSQMSDAKAQVAVIQTLLSSPGHLLFDDITKSKTIHNLVSTLSSDGVRLYMKWLKKLFESGTEKIRLEPDLDGDRRWVCMQILSLIRNPKLPRQDDWMLDACHFLLLHAFFTVKTPDSSIDGCQHVLTDPVSDQLRKQISPYFYSAVHVLSGFTQATAITGDQEGQSSSEHRPQGMTTDGDLWVLVLLRYAEQLLTSTSVEFAVEFSDEVQADWDKMYALVEKIHKKKPKKSGMNLGVPFQLLFIHVGLQMLNDPKQSVDILEDLHACYDRAQAKRKSARQKEEQEPDWVVVVTEILLSLLSKSSHLLRTVVDIVFKMICPHLTKEALGLLLNVLDPTGGAAVTNLEVADDSDDEEMEGENDEEEEEEEEEKEEEEEMDTDKPKNTAAKEGSDDSDDDDDDDEEDDDDDEDEEDPAVGAIDEALKASLKAALGGAAKDSDEDEAEESDDEFDDDTMIKIDTLLERVFLQHKTSSMTRKEMDNTVLHFKLRVLDLIEIFLKRNEKSPLILDLFEPLLLVAKVASGQKSNQVLAEKAFRIYRNRLCAGGRRYPHGIADQKEEIHQTIENIMQLAMKGHSVQMVQLASAGCLCLMKILKGNVSLSEPSPLQTRRQRSQKKVKGQGKQEEGSVQNSLLDEDRISALYNNALEDFMTKRGTCLHPVLFSDLINRFPLISWHLVEPLIKYVTKGVQLYRKTQACHLLSLLLGKRPYVGDPKVWSKQSKSTMKAIKEALTSMQGEESEVKPKFLLQLLELIMEFAKLGHHLEQPPKFDDVTGMLAELKKKPVVTKSRDIGTAMNKAHDAMQNRISMSKKNRQRNKQKHNKRKKSNRKSRMRKLKQANKQ